jgi:hypothetical protein
MAFTNFCTIKKDEPIMQLCSNCGEEHLTKPHSSKNDIIFNTMCTACRRRSKDILYYSVSINKKKHAEYMKQYHYINRPVRIIRTSEKRGLKAGVFINAPFKGSVGHHMDKQTVVYIPDWLHSQIPHQHSQKNQMELINTWSNKWIQHEYKNKDMPLELSLLSFYKRFLSVQI